MQILKTISEMSSWSRSVHNDKKTIAFVPTMGALHQGHLQLIDHAKKIADKVVVSIFVNPTQFGPKEDFKKYPREEKSDLDKCELHRADCVFIPDSKEIYQDDFQTHISVDELSKGLCGDKRKGHFKGVSLIVLKLFNITNPDFAIFGEKDFQQLRVIEQMIKDLNLNIKVTGHLIVREPDGLAMSSRNKYLSKDERKRALCLSKAIIEAKGLVALGEKSVSKIKKNIKSVINESKGKIDYIEIVDEKTLKPLKFIDPNSRLLLAVYIGKTRLIDNASL